MTGLVDDYDLVIFDLDGVLYLSTEPVAGAVAALERLRAAGVPLAYATNNASRSRADVAGLLTSLGMPASEDEVMTSAKATADLLAERYPHGTIMLVVGAPALHAELVAVGMEPVSRAEDRPAVVVQGYGPDVAWAHLAEASVAIRAGAAWVATNADATLPSPRGPLPGNGSLVAALAHALRRRPDTIVGKPDPGLFAQAARRVGAKRPLVVGDRLDTDIEGARRAGMDSLLVLTGVDRAAELIAAEPERRPTHVADDLAGLFAPADTLTVPAKTSWDVTQRDDLTVLAGDGARLDALRALATAAWTDGATPVVADGAQAENALRELGLTSSST